MDDGKHEAKQKTGGPRRSKSLPTPACASFLFSPRALPFHQLLHHIFYYRRERDTEGREPDDRDGIASRSLGAGGDNPTRSRESSSDPHARASANSVRALVTSVLTSEKVHNKFRRGAWVATCLGTSKIRVRDKHEPHPQDHNEKGKGTNNV